MDIKKSLNFAKVGLTSNLLASPIQKWLNKPLVFKPTKLLINCYTPGFFIWLAGTLRQELLQICKLQIATAGF